MGSISNLNRTGRSFVHGVSSSSIFLFDLLDIHEDDTLGSADDDDSSSFAFVTLEPEGDLLGGFSFLSEDGLGLSSVPRLFSIITSPTLGGSTFFTFFILGDLVNGVSVALTRAVGLSGFRNNHH